MERQMNEIDTAVEASTAGTALVPFSEYPLPAHQTFDKIAFEIRSIETGSVVIPDTIDPSKEKKVERHANSLEITGPRTPPVVRSLGDGKYALLTDATAFAALTSLGARQIDCVVLNVDEVEGILFQHAELFHRPEKTVLERAEIAVKSVRLLRDRVVQDEHPRGGHQPNDKGMSAAAGLLGVSRIYLIRAHKIDAIDPAAKEVARLCKLDNNQAALLEVAQRPPQTQVRKVHELHNRYPQPGRKPSHSFTKRSDRQPATEVSHETEQLGCDPAVLVEEQRDTAEAEPASPPTVPEDVEGPLEAAAPSRADIDATYERIKSEWHRLYHGDFSILPKAKQLEFVTDVLGLSTLPHAAPSGAANHGAPAGDEKEAGDA
jgi:hypothetical protein